MPSEQFERTLRERFAQAEIPPPAGLWDRIEAGVAPPVERKRRFLWIWWSMAALLFCSVGLAWVFQPVPPSSPAEEIVQTAPVIPAPQKQEVSEESSEANSPSGDQESIAQPFISDGSSLQPERQAESGILKEQPGIPQGIASNMISSDLSESNQLDIAISTFGDSSDQEVQNSGLQSQDSAPVLVEQEEAVSLFQLDQVPFFNSPIPGLNQSTAIVPVGKTKILGKWAIDISAASGYATRLFSTASVDKSFQTDYAGYANRSAYTSNSAGQVATVRFPRWHHALALETSRTLHARWRLSLGLDFQTGLKGIATLGEIDSDQPSPLASPGAGDPIIVQESSIRLGSPSAFTHVSLGIPVRLSYLTSLGRGSLEHSIGYSLNRSWVLAEPQSQLESIAFDLTTDQVELFSAINLPPPVLNIQDWHSDLRLRTRYFLPSRSTLQPFVGMELQSQVMPAFGGDAGVSQRPFLIGMELGLRIR